MHNNCLVYFHLSTFWGFIYAVIECKYLYHISTYIQYDVGLFVFVNSLIYLYSTLQYFSEYILHLPSPHYTANPKLKTKTRENKQIAHNLVEFAQSLSIIATAKGNIAAINAQHIWKENI